MPKVSWHYVSRLDAISGVPALDYRYESFDIGCVTWLHLAANRSALDVQGHAHDHLVKIGPVILIVAAFTD